MRFQLRSRRLSNPQVRSETIRPNYCLTGLAALGVVLLSGFLHYDFANAEFDLCGSFYFPTKNSPDDILKENKAALIKLYAGGEKGTGFLVDNEYGYVVTARHVVLPAIEDDLPIEGLSLGQRKKLILKVVDEDTDSDIALLQLIPPKALNSIVPLEIAVHNIDFFAEYAFGGFPFEEDVPTTMKGKLEPSRRVVAGLTGRRAGKMYFQMRVNVFGGDSGAPVVNRYGLVVGIVFQNKSTDLALVRPTLHLAELLKKLPPMGVAEDLYRQFNSGPDLDDFSDRFLPVGRTTRITNLHFLSFLAKLETQELLNGIAQKFIQCPVLIAANHRQLELPAIEIGSLFRKNIDTLDEERLAKRSAASPVKARFPPDRETLSGTMVEDGRGFSENLKLRLSKGRVVDLPLPYVEDTEDAKEKLAGFSENLKLRLSKGRVVDLPLPYVEDTEDAKEKLAGFSENLKLRLSKGRVVDLPLPYVEDTEDAKEKLAGFGEKLKGRSRKE